MALQPAEQRPENDEEGRGEPLPRPHTLANGSQREAAETAKRDGRMWRISNARFVRGCQFSCSRLLHVVRCGVV